MTEVTAVQCSVLLPDYVLISECTNNRIIWAQGTCSFPFGLGSTMGYADWGGPTL